MAYYALVPAAGSGSRMNSRPGESMPKQYLSLLGHSLIWHALSTLCSIDALKGVYVVLAEDDQLWPHAEMAALGAKLTVLRCGGATRAQTVRNGLRDASADIAADDWVLVHDAARPCVTVAQIEALIAAVGNDADDAGGLLAIPVADTLKRSNEHDPERRKFARSSSTEPREGLWQAQTPQMFRHRLLQEALDFAPNVTDEASAIEALGLRPRLVEADATNLKVTYPRDLVLAELILRHRSMT